MSAFFVAIDVHNFYTFPLVDRTLQRFHFASVQSRIAPRTRVDNKIVRFEQVFLVVSPLIEISELVEQRIVQSVVVNVHRLYTRHKPRHFGFGEKRLVELIFGRYGIAAVFSAYRINRDASYCKLVHITYNRSFAHFEFFGKITLRNFFVAKKCEHHSEHYSVVQIKPPKKIKILFLLYIDDILLSTF